MGVTYFKQGEYERYHVRVTRQGKEYSKAFRCVDGKRRPAYEQARRYEKLLIRELDRLGINKLTTAGRKRKKSAGKVRIEVNPWTGIESAVISYRQANGVWSSVARSIDKHGKGRAIRLVKKQFEKKHHPAKKTKRTKKVPHKQAIVTRVNRKFRSKRLK